MSMQIRLKHLDSLIKTLCDGCFEFTHFKQFEPLFLALADSASLVLFEIGFEA